MKIDLMDRGSRSCFLKITEPFVSHLTKYHYQGRKNYWRLFKKYIKKYGCSLFLLPICSLFLQDFELQTA